MVNMTASISEQIKAGRIAKGLSVPKLAAMIGCSPKSAYRWEYGQVTKMLPIYKERLEAVLEIKLEEANSVS